MLKSSPLRIIVCYVHQPKIHPSCRRSAELISNNGITARHSTHSEKPESSSPCTQLHSCVELFMWLHTHFFIILGMPKQCKKPPSTDVQWKIAYPLKGCTKIWLLVTTPVYHKHAPCHPVAPSEWRGASGATLVCAVMHRRHHRLLHLICPLCYANDTAELGSVPLTAVAVKETW